MRLKITHLILFFPVLMFLTSENSAAQDYGKTDSLRQIVSGLNDNQQKADQLLLLAQAFYDNRALDSAVYYNEKAFLLSNTINYKAGEAEAVYKRGLIQNRLSNYNDAITSFRHYIVLIKQLNDNKGLGKGYLNLANLLKKQGNTDSAFYYYHESLSLNSILNDTLRYIAIYNALGNLYQDAKSQYDSAADYYLKTIHLCKESGRENLLGKVYDNLGKTFTRLREYDQANKYLELALENNRLNNDSQSMALNLTNIGNNYAEQDKFSQALESYDQASRLLEPFGEIQEKIDLYNNYAVVYKNTGKYDLALKNYYKALEFYRSQKLAEGTMIALKNIGDINKRLKKYDLALTYYDSSLAIAQSTGYKNNELDIIQSVSQTYFLSGNFKKAYELQSDFMMLHDSIFDLDKTRLINELTLKYEKEQDQARILALEKDNLEKDLNLQHRTSQRNAYLYAGITIIALALFLFLYIHQKRVKDRIIAQQRIHQLEEEKKLMAAKLLVEGQEEERKRIATELHDGLGVLLSATKMQFSTILDTSPGNEEIIKKATKMLEQASGDVRKISHNMMPGLLTKLGLYEAVEDLFEDINDHEKLKARCLIAEDLKRFPENQEIMLYRIIQEMVNNTLKYAEAKNILLEIRVHNDMLDIIYTDDGKGFEVEKMLESKSIGLKSIQSRVNFLNGKLALDSKPGAGVKYEIRIPA